jgi:hypothetical protein
MAKQKRIDMEDLLIATVDSLVHEFADRMVDEREEMKLKAQFYRVLKVNCAEKARLAAMFAEDASTSEAGCQK